MKKGFTLIELIFVIVIIGILATVAIPKYINLKQNAEANSVVKTIIDTAQTATEVAVNQIDLENNTTITLKDLVSLKGKNWTMPDDNTYKYINPETNNDIASIVFDKTNRTITYSIDCTKFSDTKTQEKCNKLLGGNDTTTEIISF